MQIEAHSHHIPLRLIWRVRSEAVTLCGLFCRLWTRPEQKQSSEVWDSNVGRSGGRYGNFVRGLLLLGLISLPMPTPSYNYVLLLHRLRQSKVVVIIIAIAILFEISYVSSAYNVARYKSTSMPHKVSFGKNRNQAHVTGSRRLGDIPGFSSQKLIIQPFQWDFSIRLAFCCTNWIINVS